MAKRNTVITEETELLAQIAAAPRKPGKSQWEKAIDKCRIQEERRAPGRWRAQERMIAEIREQFARNKKYN